MGRYIQAYAADHGAVGFFWTGREPDEQNVPEKFWRMLVTLGFLDFLPTNEKNHFNAITNSEDIIPEVNFPIGNGWYAPLHIHVGWEWMDITPADSAKYDENSGVDMIFLKEGTDLRVGLVNSHQYAATLGYVELTVVSDNREAVEVFLQDFEIENPLIQSPVAFSVEA